MMHTPEISTPRTSVDDDGINLATLKTRSPLMFFGLTFALSIPFWVVGAVSQIQLLPSIPISALMIIAPMTAALMLLYRENTSAGVKALLKRSFDFNRVKANIWYVPTILLMPGIMVRSYVALRHTGVAIPALQFSLTTTLTLFIVFFVTAVGEELGWSGYAIDPLQDRYGALGGALLLGAVWAVWHYIPLLEAQRSLNWIAWWSFGIVASRVIITWLYNNTGRSVFVTVLLHRHDEPHLATLPRQRITRILRSASVGSHHCSSGSRCGNRMGAANTGERGICGSAARAALSPAEEAQR